MGAWFVVSIAVFAPKSVLVPLSTVIVPPVCRRRMRLPDDGLTATMVRSSTPPMLTSSPTLNTDTSSTGISVDPAAIEVER